MSPQEIDKLLQRYIDHECTAEEKVLVETWYHNLKDPALQSDLDPATARSIERRLWSSIKPVDPTRFTYAPYFKIAASVMVVMMAAVFIVVKVESRTDTVSSPVTAEDAMTVVKSDDDNKRVALIDGSVVDLYPHSELRFPSEFKNEREVYLTGEALFDVARDEQHAFLVYSNEVTTRVLGTSFLIKAYTQSKDITVTVKTGKVSVSTKSTDDSTDKRKEIILTPNQQLIYDRTGHQAVKMLVEDPQPIVQQPSQRSHYTTVPVAEIFGDLEKRYGIAILYDKEAMSSCMITYTDLTEEGLYEQIEIICNALGMRYEKSESSIIIKGAGCKVRAISTPEKADGIQTKN